MARNLERAAGLATRLLLSQRLYSPRIDIPALRYDKSIIFDTLSNFCENSCLSLVEFSGFGGIRDGCTIRRKCGGSSLYIVLYNEKIKSGGRRSFTLAHEIGHIYLDHENDGPGEEREADYFASQLLLPPILVWELLKRSRFTISAHELATIFGTSKMAAENRMLSLKRKKQPEFSTEELMLLKKFGDLMPQMDGPLVDC